MCAPQPVDHGGAGAALALPQQALIAGQVDEPGVPRVDPHPPPRLSALLPAGLAAAGLIDAEHPDRIRFGQLCLGVGDKGAVRGRPRHPMRVGDLGHRTGRIADRRADLGAQPRRGACPRRDLRDGLGERRLLAVVLPAAPTGLVPPHHDPVPVGDIFRRGRHPLLDRGGHHPTPRARCRRLVGRDHVHHPGPVGALLDTLDLYTWQPKQQCRTVRHGPWFPSSA